ncbi:TRAP transporter large permease [Szabonella alba]|uniref:TRAP transporter large permease n=1 Tax=Szabonella alba TaxID=2804194 RepID=A0A8K0Y276_9RHOB|nr:TRAP transporter large permease [Szabonella alba]MBL4919128.1 TRAP transporter large permease [Szabonella alba]
MDPLFIGLFAIAALLVLLAAGLHVGVAMAVVALAGTYATVGLPFMLTTAESLPYALATDFTFVVIPMFILMGAITACTGVTAELYNAAHKWTGGLRGGLYYATTLASGAFGAISGSTVVSAALFTQIALPEMRRYGYSVALSAGCICAAGTFAALIPPSVAMVIYALLVNQSVGALLMAGLLPGLLTIGVYLVGIRILLHLRKDAAPYEVQRYTLSEKLDSLRGTWATILLAVIVMGGIYSGIMFPSTAGAAGAAGALLIGVLRGRLSGKAFLTALRDAVIMTAALFTIIIGGLLLSRFLLISGFISSVSSFTSATGLTVPVFLFGIVVLYVVLGAFLDGLSMMVMTIPFVHPVAMNLGVDPIWFGVIVIKLIEIGAITPPVGLNLFAVVGASNGTVRASSLFGGITPFLIMEIVTLALLIAFPSITLFLPNQMF